jgi:pimeloyl-ACP methyl ester carboxylesterase
VDGPGTGLVRSADGTAIGYREYGSGPGLILVHGGMKAAQHLTQLARALGEDFRVYVPDRRGRGMSGPYGSGSVLLREVEDLQALIGATGARFVFGHSSGALITLRTALSTAAVDRIALYEPPLSINDSVPMSWVSRFDREMAAGRQVAATITALKGVEVDPVLVRLPRFVLTPVMRVGMRLETRRPGKVGIADLVPTQHFDMQIVQEMADSASEYARLPTRVLLIGGTKSPAYLGTALDELAKVLPESRRVTLQGCTHEGPENGGSPVVVARALRDFFSAPRGKEAEAAE